MRPGDTQEYRAARQAMVSKQLVGRGLESKAVLRAMNAVLRHQFIDEAYRGEAYDDHPLPLRDGQTISQPYIVAYMSAALQLQGGEKILEIGTGCGYQTAVLLELGAQVFSIEIVPALHRQAQATLDQLGYLSAGRATLICSNGESGLPAEAPFDRILLAAAPATVPPALTQQLAVGGQLLLPLGEKRQFLTSITRTADGFDTRQLLAVRFVPLLGEATQSDEQNH